jgi:hypothetical protein
VICHLKLSRHRTARVWLDESPRAQYVPTAVMRRVVSSGLSMPPVIRLAGVELVVPRGAMASYGLLGAELLEGTEQGDVVTVAVARTDSPMPDSLAGTLDDVRVGLPEEYASAVISGVERLVHGGAHFGGELAFRWAAHGLVGSSGPFFADLAELVGKLLFSATTPSTGDLVELFG